MKYLPIILSSLFFLPLSAQENPAALARQLTISCKTEKEKVTSIFRWITENIAYRTITKQKKKNAPIPSYFEPGDDDDSPLKPLNERVAETVLKKRTAVCDGYARLFTSLCDHAGIRSEVIIGYARPAAGRPGGRFGVNHYWNAVQIDSSWYLLDATWASGYITWQGNEFVRQYDPSYFLTPPESFIRTHYPDDARWTLLPDTRFPDEFRRSPFRQKSFSKYAITAYYPAGGILEVFAGDTLHFQLETSPDLEGTGIVPDLLIDSALFTHSPDWVFLKPAREEKAENGYRHHYSYTITSPEAKWLYLLYNDDLVLRYKLVVKKNPRSEGLN